MFAFRMFAALILIIGCIKPELSFLLGYKLWRPVYKNRRDAYDRSLPEDEIRRLLLFCFYVGFITFPVPSYWIVLYIHYILVVIVGKLEARRAMPKAESRNFLSPVEKTESQEIQLQGDTEGMDNPDTRLCEIPEILDPENRLHTGFKTNNGLHVSLNLYITAPDNNSPVLHGFSCSQSIKSIAVSKGPKEVMFRDEDGNAIENQLSMMRAIRFTLRGLETLLLIVAEKIQPGWMVTGQHIKGQKLFKNESEAFNKAYLGPYY